MKLTGVSLPEWPVSVFPVAIAAALSMPLSAEEIRQADDKRVVIEEIIVTATRRATDLQDTAIAMTAFDATAMDVLNITTAEDFALLTPSVSFSESPEKLYIRGVGRVDSALGLDPGVAVYVDGIYQQEVDFLSSDSFELAQVEILRGPQGTFFGRNATGGAVSITTKRPTAEFDARVRAKVGNYNLQNLAVSLSGPITDDIGYRFSAAKNKRDGYVETLTGSDLDQQDAIALRGQLQIDNIFGDSDLWLQIGYGKVDEKNAPDITLTPYVTDNLGGAVLDGLFAWGSPNPSVEDPRKVDVNDHGVENSESYTASAILTVPLNGMIFTSLTGGRSLTFDLTGIDNDGGANPSDIQRHVSDFSQYSDSFSQEFQLASDGENGSPLTWVGGLYYYHEDSEQPLWARTPGNPRLDASLPFDSLFGGTEEGIVYSGERTGADRVFYYQNADLKLTSMAVYFDASYSFDDQWRLSAGVRYSEDEKDVFEDRYIAFDADVLWGINALNNVAQLVDESRSSKGDWHDTSYRLVLDYKPNDNSMIYASISTGYKTGGFELGAFQGESLDDASFDAEDVLSYELGYKTLVNDVLRLNAAVFYYQYDNMQVVSSQLVAGVPNDILVNIPEADSFGVEVEALWLVTENFQLRGGLSHIESEFVKSDCLFNIALSAVPDPSCSEMGESSVEGNPTPHLPENKINVNASYTWNTNVGLVALGATYSWVDEVQYSIFDTPSTLADDYDRIDLSLRWYSLDDKWNLVLAGKNIQDNDNISHLEEDELGNIVGGFTSPRVYTFEVNYML